MKTKKSFVFNILSYLLLIAGVYFDFWGIASTLFYFVIEATINCGIAGYWFKRTPSSHAGISGAIGGALGGAALTTLFTFYLTVMSNEMHFDPLNDSPKIIQFLWFIIQVTWPLIIVKSITSYIEYKGANSKEIEEHSWNIGIHSIMSTFLSFAITLIVLSCIEINHTAIVIASLLVSRIIFDLYLYRAVLGLKLKR